MTGRPEPILTWASVVALVKAALALAIMQFGLPLTPEAADQIIQIVVLLEPFSVWWTARRHTTPYPGPTDPPEPPQE